MERKKGMHLMVVIHVSFTQYGKKVKSNSKQPQL